ncbi:hypothetical protein H5410_001143 [Solanum commersonii]|uniref:Uncharacterized protein n=1 Tax=Solanum commersonii TaxID=4109 RepID=A0A9J6AYR2_SOLCO|nr:hypothetical protein H5410_001143 [Solanum commersonii]
MNELDELVYAMEDLNLSEQEIKVFMNKGKTGEAQGKIEKFEEGDGSKSIKEEWQELEKNEMEQAYLHASLRSNAIIFAIHEMKMHRVHKYSEYKYSQRILKKCVRNPVF